MNNRALSALKEGRGLLFPSSPSSLQWKEVIMTSGGIYVKTYFLNVTREVVIVREATP